MVFDGLDRIGVSPAIIELVEDLIADVLCENLRNFSLVILGYGEGPHCNFASKILREQLRFIEPVDVDVYLRQVAQSVGSPVSPSELRARIDGIFGGLEPPLDQDKMLELKSRVKSHTIEVLRRAP